MLRFISLTLCLIFFALSTASADERILSFHSDVRVQNDGSYLVRETIVVRAEGKQIRRGIFRDIPTVFTLDDERERKVGFNLIDVKRNGQNETVKLENFSRYVRIRIGRGDVFLQNGNYTYEITYETDRQLRRFDTYDEVFWNVTGNAWGFPIDKASASIRLPEGGQITDRIFFTGPFGSSAQNARSNVSSNRQSAAFETTQPLGPREGLTVGIKFQKGLIAEPSQADQTRWLLQDFLGEIVAVLGIVSIFAYYLWAWLRVGRDPQKGTIVPRWDLPVDISPALAHYIYNRGMKKQGFTAISAAALSLAVKGIVSLENKRDTLTITKLKSGFGENLPVGEMSLLTKIDGAGGVFKINKSNGTSVKSMASKFRSDMESEHRTKFFVQNMLYVAFGVFLSVAILIAVLVTANLSEDAFALLIPAGMGGIWLTVFLMGMVKAANRGMGGKIMLAFFLFIASAVIINGAAAAIALMRETSEIILPLAAIITLAMLNVLFFFLLGAPTPLGQKHTTDIEGLRHYMSVAEEDRMNMLNSPDMSPQHYEKLLPYAVALGVEKPWSNAFQGWLAAAVAAGAAAAIAYRHNGPNWYNGTGFNTDRIADTFGDIGNDMASTMTSSLPAPKSSSSGFSSGGGFSGGGGGGGGGGGW